MFIKVGQIYSLYIHIGIDLESNQQVQMQYIHTNIHIFIKYSSIIFHTTVLYFFFFFSLFEAKFKRNFKQATLKTVQTKKNAVHKLWISVKESILQYLQYSDLHVRKIVPCLHRVPYRNGLQSQKARINSTGTRETS